MGIIRETIHVAKKEHKCMFCNGTIRKGEIYNRQTISHEGSVYDWISHEECDMVVQLLDMMDESLDEGIDGSLFRSCIDQYVYENHYDDETDDIAKEWQVPYYEQVRMIIVELKNE